MVHRCPTGIGIRRSGQREGGLRRDLDAESLCAGGTVGQGTGDDRRARTSEIKPLGRSLVIGEASVQVQDRAAAQGIRDADVIGAHLEDDSARKADRIVAGEDGGGVVGDGEGFTRGEAPAESEDAAVGQADAAGGAEAVGRQTEQAAGSGDASREQIRGRRIEHPDAAVVLGDVELRSAGAAAVRQHHVHLVEFGAGTPELEVQES